VKIVRGKQVYFSQHAKTKMVDRGATEDEVVKAIEEGSSEPTRGGRTLFRKNFAFYGKWRGKQYSVKQVVRWLAKEKIKL